jgi:hypothetical protein
MHLGSATVREDGWQLDCSSYDSGGRLTLATIYPKIASTGIVAPAGVDQAQVRAGAERAMVMYQEPPARFSVAITRKKAAHP